MSDWKESNGAGAGNRTLVLSLENLYTSRCTTPASDKLYQIVANFCAHQVLPTILAHQVQWLHPAQQTAKVVSVQRCFQLNAA